MEKEFGKLSKQQLGEVYALLISTESLKRELIKESKENPNNKAIIALDSVMPWAYWYDLKYEKHLTAFVLALDLGDEICEMAKKEDPQAAVIDLAQKDQHTSIGQVDLTNEEAGLMFSLVISNSYQIQSISIYGESVSKLLERAKNGDDESLFRGIWVDRSIIFNPWVKNRIQQATFHEDNSFLSELSRSISRVRPRKSKPELDDLRYMHHALEESLGQMKLSYEKQFELLVEDLELYPDEGKKDVFAAFKRLIQRNKSKM